MQIKYIPYKKYIKILVYHDKLIIYFYYIIFLFFHYVELLQFPCVHSSRHRGEKILCCYADNSYQSRVYFLRNRLR